MIFSGTCVDTILLSMSYLGYVALDWYTEED